MTIAGTHDGVLVVLSILIAVFASFTALNLAGRVRAASGNLRRLWVTAAAVALGSGIWSMHFVAMLAFSIPGMTMTYDLGLTLASLVVALLFTGAGFAVVKWEALSPARVLLAGLLMGSGVLAMHYIGMAAMRMGASLSYDPRWLATSALIAVGAATPAVWLAAREQKPSHRLVAAAAMGLAIAGMHYVGMKAALFRAHTADPIGGAEASLGQTYLAGLVAAATIAILLLALGAARLERLLNGFSQREERAMLRLKVADILRTGSTDEALFEVAALMGSHFNVTRTGYGQLDPAEDTFDYDICWTDGSVPPLLGRFPAAAFGVKIVAALKAGKTVVVEDLFAAEMSNESRTHETAREVDTRSILVVPFVRDGQLRTIVYLNDRSPRIWESDDVAFMEELAERTRLVIERAAAEEQLRELNLTLEARVEQRTAELRATQEALLQSQKMEAVGQLVAGLAHDFNNVLGAMVGALDLIARRADDPDRVKKLAETGVLAGERGAKLTGQLLAFSREQRIELQPLFVCDVIEAMRDLLARTLGPMIALEFDLNPCPVPVLADTTQLEMTLLNLAINARDAMPEGGSLRIGTSVQSIANDPELAAGEYVEIAVTDTGIGMDPETLRRALDPFFTTKPIGKGTGLGLAQVYGSAKQSGGTLRLESQAGVGTTVRVLLPRTGEAPERAVSGSIAPSRPELDGLRILVVDDDDSVRTIIAGALESQGCQVVEANDGLSALARSEEGRPDIALIDFAMPTMNGADLAKRIVTRWPGVPILFVSGFSDTDALEAVTGGPAQVLRKPFRVDDLYQLVARNVRRTAPVGVLRPVAKPIR